MIDDGQSPDSLGANAIDAEGYPQSKTRVVENGVLKGFLFDTYFGRSFGLESTGNCSRGSSVFGNSTPYESGPTASTKRLRVSPGKQSFDDLISNTEEPTILIKEFPIGIFHGNVATGEFSAVANEAFLVEKGEIKYPLDPVSVAGQFYEGLSNMREIGSDIMNSMFGVDLPTLVFDGFTIVG